MKAAVGSGSRFGRDKFQIVYVNSFGSHRCGTSIHYGGSSHLRHAEKEAVSDTHNSFSDRTITGCSAHPSRSGGRRPRFTPGTTLSTDAKVPKSKENEASGFNPKVRKVMTESLSSAKDSTCEIKAISSTSLDSQKPIDGQKKNQGDAFEFSCGVEDAKNCVVRRQKRKSSAWLGVSKVIAKMVEENECLRNRLMSCSQLSREGHDMTQDSQRRGSCIDTEEAIFGWV